MTVKNKKSQRSHLVSDAKQLSPIVTMTTQIAFRGDTAPFLNEGASIYPKNVSQHCSDHVVDQTATAGTRFGAKNRSCGNDREAARILSASGPQNAVAQRFTFLNLAEHCTP